MWFQARKRPGPWDQSMLNDREPGFSNRLLLDPDDFLWNRPDHTLRPRV